MAGPIFVPALAPAAELSVPAPLGGGDVPPPEVFFDRYRVRIQHSHRHAHHFFKAITGDFGKFGIYVLDVSLRVRNYQGAGAVLRNLGQLVNLHLQ